MISQKELILNELKKGRMLTRRQIRNELNINSETARIKDLKDDNNDIRTIECRSKNKRKYVKYFLVAQGIRRVM